MEAAMSATRTSAGRHDGETVRRVSGRGGRAAGDRPDPAAPLGEVCDRILTAHHDPLNASLPRIRLMLLMVADAHAGRHPELHRVLAAFARFADDLACHLGEEDRVLFPLLARADAGEAAADDLAGELAALGAAHARIGAALDEIAVLTAGFTPPADACDTYRTVMDELRALAAGVRRTVAEEDEVLFPGAARAAGRGCGGGGTCGGRCGRLAGAVGCG
jgi:regulator of cell morphogenesis and NO signaling